MAGERSDRRSVSTLVGHRLTAPADTERHGRASKAAPLGSQLSHPPRPLGTESSKLALLVLTLGETPAASNLFHDTSGIVRRQHGLAV